MPWNDRAAIFLKAADLISKKYRYKLMAATILGQGKNAWQAEIDAAAEVSVFNLSTTGGEAVLKCDSFLLACRFFPFWGEVCGRTLLSATAAEFRGCMEVRSCFIVCTHRSDPSPHTSRVEYRPLEGFVLAVSPFNFTAIGGNLPGSAYLSVQPFSFSHFQRQHPHSSVMSLCGNPHPRRHIRTISYTKSSPKQGCPRASSNSYRVRHQKLWHRQSRIVNFLACTSREAPSYSRSYGRT